MKLTFNDKNGAYFCRARSVEEGELCQRIGLTASMPASSRNESVYFTRDPYAALALWDIADDKARATMVALRRDYEASWQADYDGPDFPHPNGYEFMPFQKAGIRYILDRPHALVGDEPGLGKTITAIGVANAIEARRVLVVCPAAVRLHWRDKIREWSIYKRPVVYPILKASDGVHPNAHFTIVSYDLCRHDTINALLREHEYDVLILDEGHYLKTWDALRTRAVFGDGMSEVERFFGGLVSQSERVVALTGTPLPNRPRECYTLARNLCWEAIDWASEDTFKFRYNPSYSLPSGKVVEDVGRLPELRNRLRCNFVVRRHKKQVLKDLPDKQYELAYMEENGAIRDALKAERMLDINPLTAFQSADAKIMGAISTVRKMMGLAKVPRVAQHVQMLLDGGAEKLVVFAHHRDVMNHLHDALARYGVARIDGSVSSPRRAKAIRDFQDNPNIRVFLGQLTAAGVGIDGLQNVCSYVIFAEASWTPGDNEQAVDRLHRHGQKFAVVAQFLVVPGSFDERVLGTAIRKHHTLHDALDGE